MTYHARAKRCCSSRSVVKADGEGQHTRLYLLLRSLCQNITETARYCMSRSCVGMSKTHTWRWWWCPLAKQQKQNLNYFISLDFVSDAYSLFPCLESSKSVR